MDNIRFKGQCYLSLMAKYFLDASVLTDFFHGISLN